MRILMFSALLDELVAYPPEYHDAEQSILVVVGDLSIYNGVSKRDSPAYRLCAYVDDRGTTILARRS